MENVKELDDKLIFIRCLPLSEFFVPENIPDYDTDEHCWKSGNINILFAVDAMYTKFDSEAMYEKLVEKVRVDEISNHGENVNI